MGRYNTAVITAQGLEYIAQAISGQITLTFSRMVISDYVYPAGTDLSALTSIQSVKMSVEPASVWVSGDTVGVRGLFSNTTVQTAYNINTVGVFATNGTTEILFSVSTAISPDEMPIYNGVAPSSFIFTVQETINEASTLNVTVTAAGVATAQDIADLQAGKQDVITGAASSVTSANLTGGMALVTTAGGKIGVSSVTSAADIGNISGLTGNVQIQLDEKQATIIGGASTITDDNLTPNRALISSASGKVATSIVLPSELEKLHGVTSNVQTQLNGKQATITGAASVIASDNLEPDRVLVSSPTAGKVIVSAVTAAELARLSGVTSNVQTQLNGKQGTISGAASTITDSNLTPSRALASSETAGKVVASNTTLAELNRLSGVTSNVQTQLNTLAAGLAGKMAFLATGNNSVDTTIASGSTQNFLPSAAQNNDYFAVTTGGVFTFKTAGSYLMLTRLHMGATSSGYVARIDVEARYRASGSSSWGNKDNLGSSWVPGSLGTVMQMNIITAPSAGYQMFLDALAVDGAARLNSFFVYLFKL